MNVSAATHLAVAFAVAMPCVVATECPTHARPFGDVASVAGNTIKARRVAASPPARRRETPRPRGRTAEPALVRAAPSSGSVFVHAPTTIHLVFTVPLDPQRSLVLVLSDAMTLVNGATAVTGIHHDELLSTIHGPLRPGPYAVVWTAAAVGGGPAVRRSYLFTVGPPGPPLFPDRRVALTRRAGALTIGLAAPSDRVVHQTYTVTVSAAGHPVTDARVHLVGRSLDMDMGDVPMEARPAGAGRYVAVGDVVMAGDWQITVTVNRGRATAQAVFTYLAHY